MMFLKIPALQFNDLQRGQSRVFMSQSFLTWLFLSVGPSFVSTATCLCCTSVCSACGSPDRKSSAPSCQIVKWSMNNKSPPELCPYSAVAGHAVHSSLGRQHFFFNGKDAQKLWGLSPSLPRKQQNNTFLVWGCGSFLQQIWVPSLHNKSVWWHSQLLGMRKRQFQGRGASEGIAGEGPQSDPNNPGPDLLGHSWALLQFAHFCRSYTDFPSSALLNWV